jgi:hypothetical protein
MTAPPYECPTSKTGPFCCAIILRVRSTRTELSELIEEAEKTWRRINGPEKIKLLLEGVAFENGEPVQDDRPAQQKLAA